jgi:hypothetical protein
MSEDWETTAVGNNIECVSSRLEAACFNDCLEWFF